MTIQIIHQGTPLGHKCNLPDKPMRERLNLWTNAHIRCGECNTEYKLKLQGLYYGKEIFAWIEVE